LNVILVQIVPSNLLHPTSSFDRFHFASRGRLPKQYAFLGVVVLAAFLRAAPATAQQSEGNVILEPSEQVFCVMAALNAGGYDAGLGAASGDEARVEAREYVTKTDAPALKALEKFYAEHRKEGESEADIGPYISLALLLGPPPDFKFTVPQTDLPPDAKGVAGLVPLLKSFYQQAQIHELWTRLQERYQAAQHRYSEAVRQSIFMTDVYFRLPVGEYLGRTYRVDLDLLGAPGQVHARIYGMNYYLVVMASREPKVDEIRHQYLHFLLDPLATKYAPEINEKAKLRGIAYEAPALDTSFKEDFPLLVSECLIRAAELRLDKRPPAEVEKRLAELTASGLILVRYFNESLALFEKQDASMTVFYRQMIRGIDVDEEERRLARVKFGPAPASPPQAAVPVAKTEEDRLLDQGDNAFYRGRYGEAKSAYQQVVEKIDPKSERALFVLAVVASNTRKPDLAEDYFQKTLESAQDLRLVTWSHIYLGRLYDLRGKRDDALAQYRAASLTAAGYPMAWRAVQGGEAQPFGLKEEPHK
jgi:tetratricopeptide (TPR) repeat protein